MCPLLSFKRIFSACSLAAMFSVSINRFYPVVWVDIQFRPRFQYILLPNTFAFLAIEFLATKRE
jgi:hypothetical protein